MGAIFVRINGDLAVCVPSSPTLLTTYVLLEQEDWFEKEIAFVRKLLRHSMNAIDVGANYGLYTLTMAKLVGRDGMVWAFEPASATAACLRRSIERNGFGNIQLLESALSDHEGQAVLHLDEDSELNRLSEAPGARTERVSLTTLDRQAPCSRIAPSTSSSSTRGGGGPDRAGRRSPARRALAADHVRAATWRDGQCRVAADVRGPTL